MIGFKVLIIPERYNPRLSSLLGLIRKARITPSQLTRDSLQIGTAAWFFVRLYLKINMLILVRWC